MPAINVARTDTFETQRVKINEIGSQIFSITQGGSDLATGNLKLGDGTRTAPSLAFTSDTSLGIFKSEENTFGYVSSGQKIADFGTLGNLFYKDLIVRQKVLTNSGISFLSYGENYDAGSYNVILTGGTGEGATVSISVTAYTGSITNQGENYFPGNYSDILLEGGSGTGAQANFDVEGIVGDITVAGNGYVPGTYNSIDLTGGSGTGATGNITITGDTQINGSITNPGSGYTQGNYIFVPLLNNPTTTYVVGTVANPGTPPPSNIYTLDGSNQPTLNLLKSNTYRFDLSDASLANHPFNIRKQSGDPLDNNYVLVTKGTPGNAGAFLDLIIKPTAGNDTLEYYCTVHPGMGANINVSTGAVGSFGSFGAASIEVDATGVVSSFDVTNIGIDYAANDIVSVYSADIGGTGSGFEFTISGITYTGIVDSITIVESGSDYVNGDTLSINDADVGGGGGSGFEFTVTSFPGKITNIEFSNQGTGYQVADILTLPTQVTKTSVTVKGEKLNVATTLSTATPVITVASTAGIIPGMEIQGGSNDVGNIGQGNTVLSVDSSTQLTLSNNPIFDGSADLTFRSPGNLRLLDIADVSGILQGSLVSVSGGTALIDITATVISVAPNEVIISTDPTQAGVSDIIFIPPYKNPTTPFEYTINKLGVVTGANILEGGNGYSVGDELSVNARDLTSPIVYDVTNRDLRRITFTGTFPSGTFSVGNFVRERDGDIQLFNFSATDVIPTTVSGLSTTLDVLSTTVTLTSTTGILAGMIVTTSPGDVGELPSPCTVVSVDSPTEITISSLPILSGSAVLDFTSDESGTYTNVASTTNSANGTPVTFDITRNSNGEVDNLTINQSGFFYESGDEVYIDGSLIGGSSPTNDITITVDFVRELEDSEIYQVILDQSNNIESLLIDDLGYQQGFVLYNVGDVSTTYTIDDEGSTEHRFFIDIGSGPTLTPDINFYVGNTYEFNISDSSNTDHLFSLSKFRDGIWSPSYIQSVSTSFSVTSAEITVGDTSNILPGMELIVESGSDGELLPNTQVLSIDSSTQITLTKIPLTEGSATVSFRGYEYTDGVTRTDSSLSIKVTEETPTLYYYSGTSSDDVHQNEGGDDLQEAEILIDQNNPKTFGSGFLLRVAELNSNDVIIADIEDGELSCISLNATNASISDLTATSSLTASNINGQVISLNAINSSNLVITSPTTGFSGNITIGSTITLGSTSGSITSSGEIKTTDKFNSNDFLIIEDNIISSTTGNSLVLKPPSSRVVKVDSQGSLIIPSGPSSSRPPVGVVENGAIRFNTDSGQYEGYSASTTSWASLGGVRDLDGNTYIAAEASVGANDNTLYFYNDGNNTVSVTPNYLQFVDVKKIRSINTTAPAYTDYATNTQVTLGQYLKYQNNIYEVTVAGQTGTSGNEPTHTTGAATNGTAELTWSTTAIAPLTFEEVSEVRIDPLGFTDLVVNAELRFSNNVISTDLNDLIVRPNTGKKVTIDTNTSLVLPVGDTNQRGVAAQGSVRFNTTNSTYEGYDGTNWGSLGGVKDVDQNTYIIPELSAGSDENILYFYNNGTNTMRLSESALDFTNIDSITSQNNNLDIEAQTVTFNSLAATIDTSGTSTFIHTTQDNLDLGLSVGINVDPLLRLDTNGDIYVNKAFGTGSFDGLKLINSSFDTFELSDLRIDTQDIQLIKGGTNAGAAVLYDPTVDTGSRVTVSVHNQTTGDKEMIEYHVTDKGSDIFHTDISNLNTGVNQVSSVFDFDAQNKVRVTFTLTDLTIGDVVNITVVTNTFKK
jgi:hypothetical protein